MTHKENFPIKLVFTKKVIHKTAIFGLIYKYKPSYICFFFDGLACTGYNDTLILLYSDLENSKRFTEKVELVELPFVSGDFRFDVAYFLYKNNFFFDEYELLFLTDIHDVLFQEDIRMYNFSDVVYVVEEALISIKESNYWLNMYNLSYKSFENRTDLCAGTLLLVGRKSFSFLKDLHSQLVGHIDKVVVRANYQGTLNYLVYNSAYNYPNGFVKFITTNHGIINSIGKFNHHLLHFNS